MTHDVQSTGGYPVGNEQVEAALRVHELSVVYHGGRAKRVALDSLNLEVAPGEWVAVLGPNGSGKSTLLGVSSGRLSPTSGECHVLGQPSHRLDRSDIGVVFQATSLDPRLSVQENLYDLARLQGLDRVTALDRIQESLDRAGISDRTTERVATLSGGLARRVDVARAMLHQPTLLLLDEPTSGLDPLARETCLDQLAEIHAQGDRAIIMSTHLVEEATRADRVVMLHEGRCVADGPPASLCAEIGDRIIRVFQAGFEPALSEGWTRRGSSWTRPVTGTSDPVLDDLLARGIDLSVTQPNLADVFAYRSGTVLESEEGIST